MGTVHLPKILVLTIDDFVSAQGKGKHSLEIQAGETPTSPAQWSNFGSPEGTHSPINYVDGKLAA